VLALVAGLTAWSIAADTTPDPVGAPSTVDTSTVEPTAAATQATRPAPEASTEPPVAGGGQPVLPAGWYRYTDETGFSVAIPQGWSVQRSGTIVYFREPVGGRYLGIDQTDQPQLDPVADWAGKEAYRVGRGDFPDYRRIRLEEVPYFQKAADWEFTYLVDGGRTHVLNRGFITSPNRAYGMWWSTPDSAWDGSLEALRLIQTSFTPAG
jgi:hypothetical protein